MTDPEASEYFHVLSGLLNSGDAPTGQYKQLLFLLDRLCRQLSATSTRQFSNLFSRLHFVCSGCAAGSSVEKELNLVRIHANDVLKHQNEKEPLSVKEDILRLAYGVSQLLGAPLPPILTSDKPFSTLSARTHHPEAYTKRIRGTFVGLTHGKLSILDHSRETPMPIQVEISSYEHESSYFTYTITQLQPGMDVNLLDVRFDKTTGIYQAEMIVAEPDFLIDISTIAECFKEYGAHPLNYYISKLTPANITRHIILGNIANSFLDELVNEDEDHPVDYKTVMQGSFRQNPLGIAACPDFQDPELEKEFFENCHTHFTHLQHIIREQFPANGIDRYKGILEPAFICESLGLQGRLDFLTADYSSFIELKSGKAQEKPGQAEIKHQENHYVQMLLYFEVLRHNINIEQKDTDAYLLYSRYPILYAEKYFKGLVKQALNLRNAIVLTEHRIQQQNDPLFSWRLLQRISADTLNIKQLDSRFWEKYLRTPIDRLHKEMTALSDIEREYMATLFTFVTKEQYISKTGQSDYDSQRGISMLWNASAEEKIEWGEIIVGLRMTRNEIASDHQRITFSIPGNTGTQPNFREGDAVIFYHRETPKENACNQQVLKGAVEQISGTEISIRLRIRQRNTDVLSSEKKYAIERDYPDSGFTQMYRGLGYFLRANAERRNLLLAQRRPVSHYRPSASFNDMERVVEKAVSTEDYFLLVGPPGSGKTSQALRLMVERLLADQQGDILLVAYTNKAVDEICHTLQAIDSKPGYIRIGQEASCDRAFRNDLLENKVAGCNRRSEVLSILADCRIFVATLTTLSSRMELFSLKTFDAAIIDEASQILEPQLTGLLNVTDSRGNNAVKRFILIGDHKQLPAIVLQQTEQSVVRSERLNKSGITNLADSLFERLYRRERRIAAGLDSPFFDQLTSQGRMHPDISSFSSVHFYDGLLQCVPLPHQLEKLPETLFSENNIAHIVATRRLAFLPVVTSGNSPSYKINRAEANLTALLAKEVYLQMKRRKESFSASRHLGIITPYRSQIAAIRQELECTGIADLQTCTIDTVERFQGGQRDVILYSCCISSPFQLSFLCNTFEEDGIQIDRKLNVALTRARKQLFIIGNPEILKRDTIYRNLLQHIAESGGYCDDWE